MDLDALLSRSAHRKGGRVPDFVVHEVRVARGVEQLARDDRLAGRGSGRALSPGRAGRAGGTSASAGRTARSAGAAGTPPSPGGTAGLRRRQFSSKMRVNCSMRRILDRNLVGNPAQERLVGERRRIEVRRKHDEHVERHLELLAGVQRQVVDAALERHDPAVQQVLAAACAAGRSRPRGTRRRWPSAGSAPRRTSRCGLKRQVEHLERQLAADDRRPAAGCGPSGGRVARRPRRWRPRFVLVVLERLVVDRVEHRDRLAVDVDRVRHVHVAAERVGPCLRRSRSCRCPGGP